MGMKIEGEYIFNGPREISYAVVHDPNILLLAIPGESSMNETGPNAYEGTIKLKIGPVSGQVCRIIHDHR